MSNATRSSLVHTRQVERRAGPEVPMQPGFVDFAALSRRIFGLETSGTASQEISRTYEAAPAVAGGTTSRHSLGPPAQGTFQTLSTGADPQAQHRNSRTYEVAQVPPECRAGGTSSRIRQQGMQPAIEHNIAKAGVAAIQRRPPLPPPPLMHHVAEVVAHPSPASQAARVGQQQETMAKTQLVQQTKPSMSAAGYHRALTSEDDNSGSATEGDRATDTDAGVRWRHQTAGRRRARQQSTSTAVCLAIYKPNG